MDIYKHDCIDLPDHFRQYRLGGESIVLFRFFWRNHTCCIVNAIYVICLLAQKMGACVFSNFGRGVFSMDNLRSRVLFADCDSYVYNTLFFEQEEKRCSLSGING